MLCLKGHNSSRAEVSSYEYVQIILLIFFPFVLNPNNTAVQVGHKIDSVVIKQLAAQLNLKLDKWCELLFITTCEVTPSFICSLFTGLPPPLLQIPSNTYRNNN